MHPQNIPPHSPAGEDEVEELQQQDPQETIERVESGEYFRAMREHYADVYLNPMSDRYIFFMYTVLALLIVLAAWSALSALFPLNTPVPFIHGSTLESMFDEKPIIRPLLAHKDEDPNVAIRRYMVSEYVLRRESYDIGTLELNVRYVKAHSMPEMYENWQKQLDPSNPESPISQFQRHSRRKIHIVGVIPSQDGTIDVLYDAIVESRKETRKSRMIATIAFQYADVTIDQDTGKMTPVKFVVTGYRTRRLQD